MDFIEQWFGTSPDGGDGSLELWWIVGIAIVGGGRVPSPDHRLAIVPQVRTELVPNPLPYSSELGWRILVDRRVSLCPFLNFPFLICTCSQAAIR